MVRLRRGVPGRPGEQPSDWWRYGVIYQIYPRSFADSNGDGTGDLRGIIDHLDYLNDGTPASLGVDAIWLSPIYPSPGIDVGYDVADHTTIDPHLGSLDDFSELVAAAHRRGIRIVLDLVMNHTSDQHSWFVESRSSRTNPKRDWYLWRDAAAGRRTPNNWPSWFGGPAWTKDATTGQFYLHTFLAEQPDLNWRNPAVRGAMFDMVRLWLERGVDGFRLDVFNAFVKHAKLPDNPRRAGRRAYDRQEHLYDKDQPGLFAVLRDLRAIVDARPGRVSVGEMFGGDVHRAASYAVERPDRLNLVFNFRFLGLPWRPAAFQRSIDEWETALGETAWPCYVLGNHDRSRLVSRFAPGRSTTETDSIAKVAATLLLTLRGTPFLYYGDEIGMHDVLVPQEQLRDTPAVRFPGPRGWPSRDPARTPMQWEGGAGAGFTTGEPWLPIAADQDRNVARQAADPSSVLSWYRRLIWFRRGSSALRSGAYRPLLRRPTRALAYLRVASSQAVLVALNFGPSRASLRFDDALPAERWTTRLSTAADERDAGRLRGGRLALEPYEALLLQATD